MWVLVYRERTHQLLLNKKKGSVPPTIPFLRDEPGAGSKLTRSITLSSWTIARREVLITSIPVLTL